MNAYPSYEIRLSPSQLPYYEICPCYRPEPVEPDAVVSTIDEGTAVHLALEKNDLSILPTAELKSFAERCISYLRSLAPNESSDPALLELAPEDRQALGKDVVLKESQIVLDSPVGKPGRPDAVVFPSAQPYSAHVLDYKIGRSNQLFDRDLPSAQGADYAYRLFLRYPFLQTVSVHILLPRLLEIYQSEYDRNRDFSALEQRILAVHERVNDPFKKPVPSPITCSNCLFRYRCPALIKTAEALVAAATPDWIQRTPELSLSALDTPQARGLAMRLCSALELVIDVVKRQVLEKAKAGEPVEGYQLTTRKGDVRVQDALGLLQYVQAQFNVRMEELIQQAASVSLGKLLSALEAVTGKDRLELRKQLLNEAASFLQTQPPVVYLRKAARANPADDLLSDPIRAAKEVFSQKGGEETPKLEGFE